MMPDVGANPDTCFKKNKCQLIWFLSSCDVVGNLVFIMRWDAMGREDALVDCGFGFALIEGQRAQMEGH